MEEPTWANVEYTPVKYDEIVYYAAPKSDADRPKSLDEIDPEILRTYERLGIPLEEQQMLAGVAVDAVFDSVSVATTYRDKLAKQGIIFMSFSEAGAGASRACEEVSGAGGAGHRQLLCRFEFGCFQRWLFRLHPRRRQVPDGPFDLFPH